MFFSLQIHAEKTLAASRLAPSTRCIVILAERLSLSLSLSLSLYVRGSKWRQMCT